MIQKYKVVEKSIVKLETEIPDKKNINLKKTVFTLVKSGLTFQEAKELRSKSKDYYIFPDTGL